MLEKWNNLTPNPQRSHDAHAPGIGSAPGGLRLGGDDEHVDSWHHHDAAEGDAQPEHLGQINTALIIKWFVVIVAFVAASIVFIIIYFNQYSAQTRSTSIETTLSADFLTGRAAAQTRLGVAGQPPTWTGLEGGRVQVPLADVMGTVLEQYKGGSIRLEGTLPAGHAPVNGS